MARVYASGTDRFGNPSTVVGCKDKKGNGFPVGFVKIGGKLFKLEPSEAQKDGVHTWIRVTKLEPRRDNGFGRGGRGGL